MNRNYKNVGQKGLNKIIELDVETRQEDEIYDNSEDEDHD